MARFRGMSHVPECSGIGVTVPRDKPKHAPVAQLDRALDYESRGQEFESLRARHFGTELGTPKPAVFALEMATSVRRISADFHSGRDPTLPTFSRAVAVVRSMLPPVCPTRGAAAKPSAS
jgi:hypothetical protein